jgi:dihydroneopterin aldolase
MFTIIVKEQTILAPIGWYEEERKNKVKLLVSVEVDIHSVHHAEELKNTINYTDILRIILDEGKVERRLLESLAEAIGKATIQRFSEQCKKVTVEIKKPFVPFSGFKANHCAVRYVNTNE